MSTQSPIEPAVSINVNREAPVEESEKDRLDKFLSATRTKLDTKDLEVSSIGQTITVRELTGAEMQRISEMSTGGKQSEFAVACEVVASGLVFPDLNNEVVLDKIRMRYNNDPSLIGQADFVQRMFKSLEVILISSEIMSLSGDMEGSVQEAKNS